MAARKANKTFIIALLIYLLSDFVFFTFSLYFSEIAYVIILLSIFTMYAVFKAIVAITTQKDERTKRVNLLVGVSFGYIVCKVVAVPLLLTSWCLGLVLPLSMTELLYLISLSIGILFFTLFVLGMFNKYRYKLITKELYFVDLPKAFEGFKIIQLSDVHSGSFDSIKGVKKGVDLVNKQKADVILFTGDLVNNDPHEIDPYINTFKDLEAEKGVYSVSGNHDYHYLSKGNATYELLKQKHEALNFKMLNNESYTFTKGEDNLTIAGVENWGVPPFPQFGNLDKALAKASDFVVLMSHDPSHWDEEIKTYPKNIQLTLSGHTHGMQFGIDLPFFKWSPVKFKYPKWIDLYTEFDRYLYVNRGFGFIGYPGRVGIRPEVTSIILKKK